MTIKIINNVPTGTRTSTIEEQEKDSEANAIVLRLDKIKNELKILENVCGKFFFESGIMLRKLKEKISKLKKERLKLKNRLTEIQE